MSAPGLSVHDDVDASRFTLLRGSEVIAIADYSVNGDVVTIPYVETAPEHRGQGFAARLMDGVIDLVRANGRTIRPICSYAVTYLRERPNTHDLVTL